MATKLLLSLDYEVYFGHETGTVQNCILHPTNALIDLAAKTRTKLVLFVDAGFLVCLNRQGNEHKSLARDYAAIREQLSSAYRAGHDVQLHIHPHWERSHFDGQRWQLDHSHYKLHDFSSAEMANIVKSYRDCLCDIIEDDVFAYRAGGWCIQPFDAISAALRQHGIWLDSTVYHNGVSSDRHHGYDFRRSPDKPWWYFDNDPARESNARHFLEIPISTVRVGPMFYWKMALIKKFLATNADYKCFGDGAALRSEAGYYLEKLTRPTYSVASIDGAKANLLEHGLSQLRRKGHDIYNVIGHPKAISRHSLRRLESFLDRNPLEAVTFRDFMHMRPA